MAFTFARVDPETLQVTLKYNTNGCAKWAEGDLDCEVPFDVLADQAIRDSETGEITLVEDPAKVQAQKDAQTAQNRTKRNQLLQSADWATLSDVNLANKDEWVSYRALLRAVDLTEPVWPQEPQVVWMVTENLSTP